ncbi:hypothetical protein [Microcoleus sp. BROC3]|uniref:hypothetical protein n=1 Tax=Microcoleus sp. BROC3 TaxID=3055323 RepID=UPI002FD4684C
MDNSVRPNLRYCIIIKVKAIEERSSATDFLTDVTDVSPMSVGSSATDSLSSDVTDVRKKEEGRRKKEESQGFH